MRTLLRLIDEINRLEQDILALNLIEKSRGLKPHDYKIYKNKCELLRYKQAKLSEIKNEEIIRNKKVLKPVSANIG